MPKTSIRTIVEVTTHMSDKLKTPNGHSPHIKSHFSTKLYNIFCPKISILQYRYIKGGWPPPIPCLLLVFKKASTAVQVRRSRGVVASPTPKTSTRTTAEATTHTSDTVSSTCMVAIAHSS